MTTTVETPQQDAEPRTEQRVQWAELFLDLVWVFAVTELASGLAAAQGFRGIAETLVLLVPLWWGWVGTTLLANAAGNAVDRTRWRLMIFVIAGCGLVMAVAVPGAYDTDTDRGLVFAVAYLVLRLIQWAAMRHARRGQGLPRIEAFAITAFVAGPLVIAGALLNGGWRVGLWALAGLIQLAGPRLIGRRTQHLRFEAAHLPERFGLFVILALGETVVAVGGQAARSLEPAALGVLLLTFVIIVLMWWTYFHYGAPAARHSLESNPAQARIVRDVFSYAHLCYVAGIIAVAVGLKKVIGHQLDVPHSTAELMLAPGVALYLAGFCYSRWRMFGAPSLQRVLAALAAVALAGLAPFVPLLVTASLVVLLLLTLNVFEYWRVETGRPILLLRWPGR